MKSSCLSTVKLRMSCAVFALFFLSACQTVPEDVPPAWSERVQLLSAQAQYSAGGRISVRQPHGAEQGNFTLAINGNEFDLTVRGPFGIGAMTLVGTPSAAVLTSARTGVVELRDLDTQLAELLGYSLPMEALGYWLLGLPYPEVSAQKTFDEDENVLSELIQGGWRVEYPDYRNVEGLPMPRKIRLFGPDVEIRLAIRRWDLPGVETL